MSSFGAAGGGGADDHAAGEAVLLAELADDAAQAGALVAGLDLAGDADVIDRRHEDQEAARHRDVGREAGALGAERLLDDLDEDFLPFFEQVLDPGFRPVLLLRSTSHRGARGRASAVRARVPRPRRRPPPARCRRRRSTGSAISTGTRRRGRAVVFVAPLEPLEFRRGDDLRDVEKRVALEADVNEGGLHAGEDLRDPALVDIANDTALILALDEDLDDLIVLEDRDTRVVTAGGDDHLLVHGRSSSRPGRRTRRNAATPLCATRRRRPSGRGARRASLRRSRGSAASWDSQFVNRRILTLRMSPKVAIVAISDEPP